jgi:hypothetical protein
VLLESITSKETEVSGPKAREWFEKAAAKGDEFAKAWLGR